jgi:hypothetical protein
MGKSVLLFAMCFFSKLHEPFLDSFLLIFDGEDEVGCRFRGPIDL